MAVRHSHLTEKSPFGAKLDPVLVGAVDVRPQRVDIVERLVAHRAGVVM